MFGGGRGEAMAPLLRNTDADVRLQASGCLQAIALERDAKMPVCEAARVNLVMLLRDPVVGVVQNAVAAIPSVERFCPTRGESSSPCWPLRTRTTCFPTITRGPETCAGPCSSSKTLCYSTRTLALLLGFAVARGRN